MEKIHQVINKEGLQIPLPVMERYGLRAGANVIVAIDESGIHITRALPHQTEIENFALRYLLFKLGDAVVVRVNQQETGWLVDVLAANGETLLGKLHYRKTGELDLTNSTDIGVMRQKALDTANL